MRPLRDHASELHDMERPEGTGAVAPAPVPPAGEDARPGAAPVPGRFRNISLAELAAQGVQPPEASFDSVLLAHAGARALAEIEQAAAPALARLSAAAAGEPAAMLDAMRAVIDLQNRRIASLTGLVYLLDRQLNAHHRPLHEVLRIDPLPMAHLPGEETAKPEPLAVLFASDRQFIGRNWHPREQQGAVTLRWSGPGPVSTVLVPNLRGGRLRFTFQMWSPPWIDIRFHLSARMGRVALDLARGQEDGLWEAVVDLPKTADEEYEVLSFTLKMMESPASMGTGADTRKLGIAMSRIEIARA
ncbi:hypothetical protein SAMN02745775_101826 [Falsiroseomonas stagni DSM 19981]|uniref:Uncharacterized protein n=2 Tax=Falsiroseomonas TaxID=2870713 RepID=A0A1I3Y0G1_9PROT|nr:hypothetical protein SAMN02745775_101826 [Falsiroseomonas stagni DSM 19981]